MKLVPPARYAEMDFLNDTILTACKALEESPTGLFADEASKRSQLSDELFPRKFVQFVGSRCTQDAGSREQVEPVAVGVAIDLPARSGKYKYTAK